LWFKQQEPTFKLPDKSREMKMNWLFEAYSNVYNTAMGRRPFHHVGRGLTLDQRRHFEHLRAKNDV